MKAAQPTGTVTLLFTDIEGSTRLLERLGPERYRESLELHRRLLRGAFERHGGHEVDYEGDAFFVAFARARDAVEAASEAQRALAQAEWPEGLPIRVRMGIHTGEPLATPPKYVGLDVHKAARIMAAGHGEQVVISAATQRLLSDAHPLRPLGEHRLKDLSQPEPLYQLLAPGLQSEFPALKTLGNRPNNLPIVATPFVGRECELAVVHDLLLRKEVRLLTLTGTGGIGKTRLALQAAADAIDGFRDGVYWVPFAALRDAELAVATATQMLGLRDEAGESVGEALRRYLAARQILLVLDNLEHILGAARVLVADLLRSGPEVSVLVTSREALRVSGEQLYDVPPLAVPEVGEVALGQNDAATLFIGRAQAADPSFVLTAENAPTLVEIVRRLEGLPLAIELAAARIRALPPAALLERLDNRLRLLTAGVYDADERQRTLRATIEWSHDLLTTDERTLFARLGVFVGGCRLEAAEAVCNWDGEIASTTLDGVSSLIDKSLLRRREDPDGQPRYWMLETIREFALAALQEDPAAERVREMHAVAIAEIVEGLDRDLRSANAPRAIAELAAEQPNLRAALAYVQESKAHDLFVRLVGGAAYFWYLRGTIAEGATYARRAVQVTEGRTDATRGVALHALAAFTWHLGNLELAETLAAQAAALAEADGDADLVLWAVHMQAVIAASLHRPEATALYERAAALGRERDDPWFEMMALLNLGDLALQERRLDEALRLTADGIDAATAIGDNAIIASGLASRGSILLELQRRDEGVADLLKAATVAEAHGYFEPVAWAGSALAIASLEYGFLEDAAFLIGYTDRVLADHGYSLRGREADVYAAARDQVSQQLAPEAYDERSSAGDAAAREAASLADQKLKLLRESV